jgi:Fe-S oxidoreductase
MIGAGSGTARGIPAGKTLRICLSNPCWRDCSGRRGIRAGCRVPTMLAVDEQTFIPFPFLLAYGAAALEEEGFSCTIIDAIAENIGEETYFERVAASMPDLIVNEIATASLHADLETALKLKRSTGARIAVCGPHASALPSQLLAHPQIDFVLIGEIEKTLIELAKALAEGHPTAGLPGLAVRDMQGNAVIGKRRVPYNINALPHPHRATLPMQRYRVAGYPTPTLYMYASRGCPFHCTYCLWPQTIYGSGRYRARDIGAVAEEIAQVQAQFGPFRSIYYDDDTFNVGKKRMYVLADELERRNLIVPFGCNARADLFDQDVLDRLASVGLFNIRIGAESGDPNILARARKDLDPDAIRKCIEMAHRAGIRVHVTFTVGLSGESWNSVRKTIAFARRLAMDSAAFTITTPYPGTAYYDEVVTQGLLNTQDWRDFNVVHSSVIRTDTMRAEEITRAEKLLMRGVYYSPRFIWRRLRYVANAAELTAIAKKGKRLLLGKY